MGTDGRMDVAGYAFWQTANKMTTSSGKNWGKQQSINWAWESVISKNRAGGELVAKALSARFIRYHESRKNQRNGRSPEQCWYPRKQLLLYLYTKLVPLSWNQHLTKIQDRAGLLKVVFLTLDHIFAEAQLEVRFKEFLDYSGINGLFHQIELQLTCPIPT